MTRIRLGRKIAPSFSLDVDFAVGPGILALFGPSGAGKTSILEMTAGYVAPHSGRILLDDSILYDAETRVSLPPQRRACGYVPQRDTLFPHMSVRDNLAFAAGSLPRLERHRRVNESLDRFGLANSADALPDALAAAERRRAAAARALIASPRLLLLDERGWDEPSLAELRECNAAPIVLVTSDLDLCCAAAAEMLVLEGGRILQRGAPHAIIDQPGSVEAARLLGIPNIFSGAIASLDPGRNTSRIELDGFALAAPYIPGHFRGDRVSIGVHPGNLRVHAAGVAAGPNCVPAALARVSMRARTVRLEFAGGIFVDLTHPEFARHKDNQGWQVEFPPEALRVL
jgi:molybdate transport system ATP-binding protein